MSDLIPLDPTQRDHRPAVYEDESGDIVYRASAIGYCTKMLAALRQEYDPKPLPDNIKEKMDESADLEDEAVDRFIADHHEKIVEIDRQVPPISLKVRNGREGGQSVYIRGKPDTRIKLSDGRVGILEVKNLGDALYKANSVSLQSIYKAQGTVYMVGYDFIVFVLRNKRTGNVIYKWFDTTPMDFGALFRKVLEIETLAEKLELPDLCDPLQYPCPVHYLHEKERIEPWEDMKAQWEFEELARAYDAARAMEKEGKEAKKAIQAELRDFRARHLDLVGEDGALNSSKARFSKSTPTRKQLDETGLEWFLAKHGKGLEDYQSEVSYDAWYVSWRG